jgi:hypothetical protein
MRVTFTKVGGRRYVVTVIRERGPELAPRQGPGYDDYLPHDAVHFLVEAESGLTAGVFGQIAAGRNNLFWPADPAQQRRQARKERKLKPRDNERADMARSEELASVCWPLWELRVGHRREPPAWFSRVQPGTLESPLVERILARLDVFAAQWHSLPGGGSITLTWPMSLPRRVGLHRQAGPCSAMGGCGSGVSRGNVMPQLTSSWCGMEKLLSPTTCSVILPSRSLTAWVSLIVPSRPVGG